MRYKGKAVLIILTLSILVSAHSLAPSKTKLPPENKPAKRALTNKDSDDPALEPIDKMAERLLNSLNLTGATVAVVKNEN